MNRRNVQWFLKLIKQDVSTGNRTENSNPTERRRWNEMLGVTCYLKFSNIDCVCADFHWLYLKVTMPSLRYERFRAERVKHVANWKILYEEQVTLIHLAFCCFKPQNYSNLKYSAKMLRLKQNNKISFALLKTVKFNQYK